METEAGNSSLLINNNMEKRVGRHHDEEDDDLISALPNDVLLLILQRLDLRTAVRAGAVARRWRRLPRLLPDLDIDVATLIPHHPSDCFSVDEVMAAYTDAMAWFLLPPPDIQHHRKITSLRLAFYLAENPYLRTIGDAIAATNAERADLDMRPVYTDLGLSAVAVADSLGTLFPRRLRSFLDACPAAFAQLTGVSLHDIVFCPGVINVADLLGACQRLEILSLSYCMAADIKIDAPGSSLLALELQCCSVSRIELTMAPKLERLMCDVNTRVGSLTFGCVPQLHVLDISALHLLLNLQTSALLSPDFSNLRDVRLCDLDIPDMVWIPFLLQAAPLLNSLSIELSPWSSTYGGLYKADKTLETPKFEHRNLCSLEIINPDGIHKDVEVTDYVRLITECAVCLKRTHLREK